MSKGLEVLARIKGHFNPKDIANKELFEKDFNIIEKELNELDKIKARLVVVNMKLTSKREECVENMNHTDEDDFVHEASQIEMRCIDWFRQLLKEVLL